MPNRAEIPRILEVDSPAGFSAINVTSFTCPIDLQGQQRLSLQLNEHGVGNSFCGWTPLHGVGIDQGVEGKSTEKSGSIVHRMDNLGATRLNSIPCKHFADGCL